MFLGGGEETFGAGPPPPGWCCMSLGGSDPPPRMVLHVLGGVSPPPQDDAACPWGGQTPPQDDAVSSDAPPPVGATCACSIKRSRRVDRDPQGVRCAVTTRSKYPNLFGGRPRRVQGPRSMPNVLGAAPHPQWSPRSPGATDLRKSRQSRTRALCNRGRRTHLRVAALPAASRASICSFASCPLDAALSGAAAAAHC